MEEVVERIFEQENLESLFASVLDTSDETRNRKQIERQQCEKRFVEARKRLSNPHDGIEIVRQNLVHDDSDVRQRVARAFISRIRDGSKIEIEGETAALEHGVAEVARSKAGLPSFDRKWCATQS